jgi:DNA-directed RNA polymerase specialized sigma24 family protein
MAETPKTERPDAWGAPTDWSLVAGASQARSGPEAEQSWRVLLERYRHPIKLAVSRKLWNTGETDDVVDAFFSYLYTGNLLSKVDPERGRFRCFLQGVLKRYMLHEFARAAKHRTVALEHDVAVHETPEIEHEEEADWAAAVLRNANATLLAENPRGGELLLRLHGVNPYPLTSTEELCESFELKPNALYQAVFRARKRLRELVLAEIRHTVLTAEDYELEKDIIIARLLEIHGQMFVDPG